MDWKTIHFTSLEKAPEETTRRETQPNASLDLFGFAEPCPRVLCVTHISTIPNTSLFPKPQSRPASQHFLIIISYIKSTRGKIPLQAHVQMITFLFDRIISDGPVAHKTIEIVNL